ncbi:MAG: hypothetical protein L6R39_005644 [Caloplaca ligustica]|nr:MAG: hypothetical protein L6R39_005644 [Caloplaca ligustica]
MHQRWCLQVHVALTRPKSAIVIVTDIAVVEPEPEDKIEDDQDFPDEQNDTTDAPKPKSKILKDTYNWFIKEDDQELPDEQDDTKNAPKPKSKILKDTYNWFKGEGSIVYVDKDQLPEDLIDFAPARAFQAGLAPKTCNYCKKPGHIAKNGTNEPAEKVFTCNKCGEPGHEKLECTKPRTDYENYQCRNCQEYGHKKSDCPEPIVPRCSLYREPGHGKNKCPLRHKKVCKFEECYQEGHQIPNCPLEEQMPTPTQKGLQIRRLPPKGTPNRCLLVKGQTVWPQEEQMPTPK